MQIIPTSIVGHQPSGKCSLTGKDNTECFLVRVGNGEGKLVGAARLIEVLRWNCSIKLEEPATRNQKGQQDAN